VLIPCAIRTNPLRADRGSNIHTSHSRRFCS
jgi:hypothetical protein